LFLRTNQEFNLQVIVAVFFYPVMASLLPRDRFAMVAAENYACGSGELTQSVDGLDIPGVLLVSV
jgi:hypothetical protein